MAGVKSNIQIAKGVILTFTFLLSISAYASISKMDSLRNLLEQSSSLESRYNMLNQIFNILQDSNTKIDEPYEKEMLELAEKIGGEEELGRVHEKLGMFYYNNYEDSVAIVHLRKALSIYHEGEDEEAKGRICELLAQSYFSDNDLAKSLKYDFESISIYKSLGDVEGLLNVYIGIGRTYLMLDNYDKALLYYERLVPLCEKTNDFYKLSVCLNAIATIHQHNRDYNKSIKAYERAYVICDSIDDIGNNGKAAILSNLSELFLLKENLSNADSLIKLSLNLSIDLNDSNGIAQCHLVLGKLSMKRERYDEAERQFLLAFEGLEDGSQSDFNLKIGHYYLSKLYKEKKEYFKAYNNRVLYQQLEDSIYIDQIKKTNELERRRIKEKNEGELELIRKKNELASYRSRNTIISVGSVSSVLFVLLIMFLYRYRNNKQSSLVLEERNRIIRDKNREVIDSISYARRIQNAILPSDDMVSKYLPESFILFKPKDIVAGDFYWLEQKEDKVLFAVADCTGHGVPGAMVSVFCNNALNRSVHEKGLTMPGKVLDKSREIIISEFEKSDEEVKDGMDIALCSLDGMTLEYAGAHNPLWIVRNRKKEPLQVNTTEVGEFAGEEFEDVLYEVKGERQPVGKFRNSAPFTTHTIKLLKGDMIYLFSDGFVDQFGGEKGKKFMVKKFKRLLLRLGDANLNSKRKIVTTSFEEWKGDNEQVDDVCVIGVQV